MTSFTFILNVPGQIIKYFRWNRQLKNHSQIFLRPSSCLLYEVEVPIFTKSESSYNWSSGGAAGGGRGQEVGKWSNRTRDHKPWEIIKSSPHRGTALCSLHSLLLPGSAPRVMNTEYRGLIWRAPVTIWPDPWFDTEDHGVCWLCTFYKWDVLLSSPFPRHWHWPPSLIPRSRSRSVSRCFSGVGVAGCARPRWSRFAGQMTRPIWTPASWSRRAAAPAASGACPGSTTGPAATSSGRRGPGTTCTGSRGCRAAHSPGDQSSFILKVYS